MNRIKFDYILVGGGLQSGLLALAIRHHQPHARLLLLERDADLGGNHTWSFHATDLPESSVEWGRSLAQWTWSGYSVKFLGCERRIDLPYCSLTSDHLARLVTATFENRLAANPACSQILNNTEASELNATHVRTSAGARFSARCVIDCRGPKSASIDPLMCGFQKFVGWEIDVPGGWPHREPVVMDARGDQLDGFRFFYSLPFQANRVLIEDTCFSEHSALELSCYRSRLENYLHPLVRRWHVRREESGCLPMPFSSNGMPLAGSSLAGGYAGGWFHAATGYSFPLAVKFAQAVATTTPERAGQAIRDLAASHRRRAQFARFLNRLLYRLVRPETRWQIFRRFYFSLPNAAISRFYAHEFNFFDASRIVLGKPPRGLTPVRFFQHPKAQAC
jgi:lycopene beta-cyclase